MENKEFFVAEAKKVEDEALEALKGLIRIDSVYDESTRSEENPFGLGVRKALDYVAQKGKELGFNVDFCDHYCTELSYGEGKTIDVYAHCDVVPVSKNWKTDPFIPTIVDDVMYARGAADDKGPGMAALYGAKICLDHHLLDGVKLRLLFGGNEERDSLCLDHYFHALKKGYPAYGFSPDADYPLIFAEKGIYAYEATYRLDEPRIPAFRFGNAMNIVLDEVEVELKDGEKYLSDIADYQKDYPEVKIELKDGNRLHIKGKASHGSVPEKGVNAGLHLLNFYSRIYNRPELNAIFLDYAIGDGRPFGGNYSSKYFAGTSYCMGIFSYDGKDLKLLINVRIPENVTVQEVLKNVAEKTGAEVKYLGGSDGFMIDPESPFIQTLLNVYREETGDVLSKPLAIGGGTYCRESKNSVAFGMEYPGVDCLMHQDGEFLRLKDFRQGIAIYAHAIAALAELVRTEEKK